MRVPCQCRGGATECSWGAFINRLPPDDPVRLRDEAGDPLQDWEDPRWTGESCQCACHDGEYDAQNGRY